MKTVWSLLVMACLVLAAASAFGQDVQTKGTIGGTVTDQAGAVVPNVAVKAIQESTNVEATALQPKRDS